MTATLLVISSEARNLLTSLPQGSCESQPQPSVGNTPISFERMFRRRKLALFDLADEFLYRAEHGLFHIGVALDEFRHEVVKQAEHIMNHQHLTVALHARANTDSRDS